MMKLFFIIISQLNSFMDVIFDKLISIEGVFVVSLSRYPDVIRCLDSMFPFVIQVNGVSFVNVTAEQSMLELGKPSEMTQLIVQYDISGKHLFCESISNSQSTTSNCLSQIR